MSKRTLISYAHDSSPHANSVLAMANRLRCDGVDAHIDQYEQHPSEGWPKWMEHQFANAEAIVVVASARYLERYNQEGGVGSGARFEGAILSSILLKNGVSFEKIAVVILAKSDEAFIPDILHGCPRYDLSDEIGYESLCRWLTEQPRIVIPPLGTIKPLPPIDLTAHGRFLLLCRAILPIFEDNWRIFRDFGPNSGADGSGPLRQNVESWYEIRRSKIVPNNARIRALVSDHRPHIPDEHRRLFERLLSHIDAFEAHVANDRVDYRDHQFPKEIVEIVRQNGA
jgi:hypothetical protein